MTGRIGADFSQVNKLGRDLVGAQRRAIRAVTQAARTGGANVKKDAAATIRGYRHSPTHLPSYPSSISYDVTATGSAIVAEIGPDKEKRQGPLGNLLEYGSANNAPMPHLQPALEREDPEFETRVLESGYASVFPAVRAGGPR